MMDKSQRKGENIEALNASDVSRTRTFEPEDRGNYLTTYAYEKDEEEFFL